MNNPFSKNESQIDFWQNFIRNHTQTLCDLGNLYLVNPQHDTSSEKHQKQLNNWKSLQENYLENLEKVFTQTFKQLTNSNEENIQNQTVNDRRFQDSQWTKNPIFFYIKETYLLHTKYLQQLFKNDNLDEETQKKVDFHLKNFLDALSPTNFPFTNPEVIRETLNQNGKNLIKGYENFIKDQQKKSTFTLPLLTNLNAFKVGENLAITKGTVIYKNEIFQLLQYLPAKEPFYEIPLLIIPPWINKYYIFDLQKENSFIRWNVERGRAVYVISWINPDSSYAQTTLEDYLLKGVNQAVMTVKEIIKSPKVNALGFCVGGVALLTLLSYYQKKGQDNFNCVTLLASPVNFKLMGDLSIFVNKQQLTSLEPILKKQGGLEGDAMMHVFRSLRANELIWPNYINNYLLGKKPKALDLLFWNSDITNLPAKMHLEYLKEFYIGNALDKKNKYFLNGQGIDISQIQTPSFVVATQRDHIVPWKAAYAGFQKIKNSVFVLGGSGHIAGIINPPAQKKYSYWTNKNASHLTSPDEWLKGATEEAGSWWKAWEKWLTPFSGKKKLTASDIISTTLEEAPGSYALQKAPSLTENNLFSSLWGNFTDKENFKEK